VTSLPRVDRRFRPIQKTWSGPAGAKTLIRGLFQYLWNDPFMQHASDFMLRGGGLASISKGTGSPAFSIQHARISAIVSDQQLNIGKTCTTVTQLEFENISRQWPTYYFLTVRKCIPEPTCVMRDIGFRTKVDAS